MQEILNYHKVVGKRYHWLKKYHKMSTGNQSNQNEYEL
jgi:hypothetical protein